ncbi:Isoleucine--tRNA ligase [Candidatus Methanobinarius endosymbioticus]|uniref:Valine--tRNA ligase n=1 Tax=Candidatus Methanobinarius endosymbioticus TaxID=2006182 RepID=A0A366MA74_9EURY|nr:Isoleucine--tRNA ligase [Candidatus Methanobinarius endosymbioticus]
MTIKDIPKDYDHKKEKQWQKKWDDGQIYKFIGDGKKPRYIIDTPPPYPTGSIHMGHVLNWLYIDINARFRRLKGMDVMFPQGWDCHGLPTEVKVEEINNIKKNDVSRADFRQMCVDLTKENISLMKNQMKFMGFSQDWSREYITMTPKYMRKTQLSFLKMYDEDLIYHGIHPVNWCPRCETAIAFAEVEYINNDTYLNHVNFPSAEKKNENGDNSTNKDEKDGVLIATTRPELMSACVGVVVSPDDKRYSDIIGKEVEVPLSGQKVKVIADEEVDPEFGTGAVMVCTFGDKTDVSWVNKHDLDIIEAIDEKGIMTKAAGKYEGMTLKECKLATVDDLKEEGCIVKQEPVDQKVGQCWRCKTPIEILVKKQWFVAVSKFVDDIKSAAESMNWIPEHMKSRLLNWADSMEWDWCISRQRIFATPIPVWFCNECGKIHLPSPEELPIDPTQSKPSIEACECGSTSFTSEEDVLDTWMDSSISPLNIASWPESSFKDNFPANLRPQGHDIIRTWAFYTILRTLALEGEKPFEEIVINGMVFGEDGYKMSKSRGNVIGPEEVIGEYGVDSLRIWAANSVPGSDVPFDWKDIKYGYKFLRKFWNAFRFIGMHILEDEEDVNKEEKTNSKIIDNLMPLDQWILSKLNNLNKEIANAYETYNFATAINSIEKFVWHDFCDEYIEAVKYRLYNDDISEDSRLTAKYTLKTVVETSLKLLAPIAPHFADEVYQYFNEEEDNQSNENNKINSINTSKWPKPDNDLINETIEDKGQLAIELISEIRRFKSASKIPLNVPLEEVNIYTDDKLKTIFENFIEDIKGTLKINNINIQIGKPYVHEKVVEITPAMDKIGPQFKGEAPKIIKYLSSTSPEEIAKLLETNGKIIIEDNIITHEHVNMEKEIVGKSDKKVDVVQTDNLDAIFEITR